MTDTNKPDGQGHAVLELFPGFYFRRVPDVGGLPQWQVCSQVEGERDVWASAAGWGGMRSLDRIAELLVIADPSILDEEGAEHDEDPDAPRFQFGDELNLGGRVHMVVGSDQFGRYVAAPMALLLSVTVDGDKLTAAPFNPVRPGESAH